MSSIFPSKERQQTLMTLLKMLGGDKVEVSFSGGGDSGEVNSVELIDPKGGYIVLDNAELEWEAESSDFDAEANKWVKVTKVELRPLAQILTDITYAALDTTSLDWYNNDGGQGTLTIDLTTTPPSIELNVEINYTHTESHGFEFTDEEEEE
jgi:hypothetical protein